MKTMIFFPVIILCSIYAISYSQIPEKCLITNEKKVTVGLELNPLSDSIKYNIANIFSPAYSYWNPKPEILGIELSESYYNKAYPWMESYGVSLAIYAGNRGAYNKKIHFFGDLNRQYGLYLDKPIEHFGRESYIYMAPGISLFSKNRKFSLGIYQKAVTPVFLIGSEKAEPLRANFHF